MKRDISWLFHSVLEHKHLTNKTINKTHHKKVNNKKNEKFHKQTVTKNRNLQAHTTN